MQTTHLKIVLGKTKFILSLSWPYIAIILAHFIWGSNFVVTKLTLQEFPPMTLAFLRFSIAIILIIPFIIVEKKPLKIERKDLPKLLATGILMTTFNIALFYAGLSRSTAIDASILTLVIPIFSVVAGWWFLKEKIYVINLAGIVSGLFGAVILIGVPLTLLGLGPSNKEMLGNILIILSSLAWVIGALFSRELLKKYSTLTVTVVVFMVGIITFLLPAINEYIQNPSWVSKITPIGILGVIFIAVMSSITAYFLFEWALSKIGVYKTNLFQYLEPVVATIMAILILGERVNTSFMFGSILVGLGVYLGTLGKTHHHHSTHIPRRR